MSQTAGFAAEVVTMADDYAGFFREAYALGWTDGLPVVPPTADLVAAALRTTVLDADHVVGYLPPLGGAATVEAIAINAVMAGCLPEYLPVVIAGVEAMCDPAYQLDGPQVTTNAVAPVFVVNGPVRARLDIHGGAGCMGPGWRSNATIGRALSLVLRNIGGAKPPVSSKSTHAQPARYTFCFGEWEEENPWEPLHVEHGFAPEESTITVAPISGTLDVNSGNLDHEESLRIIGYEIGSWGNNGLIYCGGVFVSGVVVMTPHRAQLLARAGLSKADTKRRLWEESSTEVERLPYRSRHREPMLHVEDGKAYGVAAPEDLTIVIGGAVEPYHATWMPGFTESRPVTRAIDLSALGGRA